MSIWFEYIENEINPALMRELCRLDDEALKLTFATVICSIAGEMQGIPVKTYRSEIAKRLIKLGKNRKDVTSLTGISERTYFNLKKELEWTENDL